MRWETVKSTAEQEIYELYKDDQKRLTLIYNPFSNSARVECNKEKRVFLVRKEGFRRNKTVIRSEYGIINVAGLVQAPISKKHKIRNILLYPAD